MKLIIIGTGQHSEVIYDTSLLLNYDIIEYVSYKNYVSNKKINILTDLDKLENKEEYNYIIGIGDNYLREKIYNEYNKLRYVNIIHPNVTLSDNIIIGTGNFISANVVIQVSTIIGNHNIINTKASIDHHNIIGNFNHIAPNCTLCGNVNIKNNILIGASSTVLPKIEINESIIGANSLILHNIIKKGVYYGNPIKFIKEY